MRNIRVLYGSAFARRVVMKRESAVPLRGVHVLIVCDDTERCELFKHAIAYCGALTTGADSAARALIVMERLQVDVLVVDVRVEDRIACIEAVRASPPEVGGAVVALALTPSIDDRDALLAAGFQAQMTMPVRGAELCEAIATLARRAP